MGSSLDRDYVPGTIHAASATTLLIQRLQQRLDAMRDRVTTVELRAWRLLAAIEGGVALDIIEAHRALREALEVES